MLKQWMVGGIDTQVMVDKHVKVAYENWKKLIQEYDGGTIEMNPSSQGTHT